MLKLEKSLIAWGSADFNSVLIEELKALDKSMLPLQQGLSQSNYVSDSDIKIIIMNVLEEAQAIKITTGIFYSGIISGSCCSDDPTPVDEINEYCDVTIELNKLTSEAVFSI